MAKSSIEKKIEKLFGLIETQNQKINEISEMLNKFQKTEQVVKNRAITEQLNEQTEQQLSVQNISEISGRYREVLALLINFGYHTYGQIARKLNISESRARAYVAELKNNFNVPLMHVRDAEGYKIGVDNRFVDKILAFR